jgi:hypothetical protein
VVSAPASGDRFLAGAPAAAETALRDPMQDDRNLDVEGSIPSMDTDSM